MAISMHSASVPIFVRMLGNIDGWLDKAEAHAAEKKFEPSVYLGPRLAPDMLPFTRQIQIACDAAKFCVARLAGTEAPKFEDNETTFAELRQRIRKTIDYVQSVPAAQIDGSDEREISVPRRAGPLHDEGRDVPQALRAAELLLPRHDRLRAAAPQRREPRQGRLSRRVDHGRLRRRRPAAACAPRAAISCGRGARKCRSSSASRPAARAWSWRQATRLKTSSREVPELVQRAGDGDARAHVRAPPGVRMSPSARRNRAGPRRAPRCASVRRAAATQATVRRRASGGRLSERGAEPSAAAEGTKAAEQALEGGGGHGSHGAVGRGRATIVRSRRCDEAANSAAATGQFRRPCRRRRAGTRSRRRWPCARRCTSTRARPARRA